MNGRFYIIHIIGVHSNQTHICILKLMTIYVCKYFNICILSLVFLSLNFYVYCLNLSHPPPSKKNQKSYKTTTTTLVYREGLRICCKSTWLLVFSCRIHKLIHKKCHQISCHNDSHYHMTLNTIFLFIYNIGCPKVFKSVMYHKGYKITHVVLLKNSKKRYRVFHSIP